MDHRDQRFLIIRNIEHYERLLVTELDERDRDTIIALLKEARHELLMHDREAAS